MHPQKLILIAGPTAVGKTDLSIALAKELNGAIISADSMQVYQGMDIGSAKIKPEEMQGIVHYGIDLLSPFDAYNVVRFQQMAKNALEEIYKNNQIPILVGGTGFYIQALLYDIDFADGQEAEDTTYRQELEALSQQPGGKDKLYQMLLQVDPKSCEEIHCNNVKRVIRALEYFKLHNAPISEHNAKQREKTSPYAYCFFVLEDQRERLYERINSRVDKMLEEGLLEEVKTLKTMGLTAEHVSMQGLGYKEILRYLEGEMTFEDAIYTIKRDTRHFAKRQLTWFRREPDVKWLSREDYPGDAQLLEAALAELKRKEII